MFMARTDVEECAAVGIPDSVMGEVPVIFVVLAPGSKTTLAELEEVSISSLARYKRPTPDRVHRRSPPKRAGQGATDHPGRVRVPVLEVTIAARQPGRSRDDCPASVLRNQD